MSVWQVPARWFESGKRGDVDDFDGSEHHPGMTIQLTKDQFAALQRHVDAGHYANLETALAAAVHGLDFIAPDDDDADWMKPLIAEGVAEADRGELIPFEQVVAEVDALLKSRGG